VCSRCSLDRLNSGSHLESGREISNEHTILAELAACRNEVRSRFLQNFAKSQSPAASELPFVDQTHHTCMSAKTQLLPALPLSVQFWWSSSMKSRRSNVSVLSTARLQITTPLQKSPFGPTRLLPHRISFRDSFAHFQQHCHSEYTVSMPNQRSGPRHVEKSGCSATPLTCACATNLIL